MKYNKKYIRILVWTMLVLFTASFIFSNSMKNGVESNEQSAGLVDLVERILDPEDKIPTETFNFIVRKAAHFTEFAMLGFTLGGLTHSVYIVFGRLHIAAPILASLITAVTDEFIQSFTRRTSSVSDVLIDFSGAVVGLTLVGLCAWIYELCRKRKSNK